MIWTWEEPQSKINQTVIFKLISKNQSNRQWFQKINRTVISNRNQTLVTKNPKPIFSDFQNWFQKINQTDSDFKKSIRQWFQTEIKPWFQTLVPKPKSNLGYQKLKTDFLKADFRRSRNWFRWKIKKPISEDANFLNLLNWFRSNLCYPNQNQTLVTQNQSNLYLLKDEVELSSYCPFHGFPLSIPTEAASIGTDMLLKSPSKLICYNSEFILWTQLTNRLQQVNLGIKSRN